MLLKHDVLLTFLKQLVYLMYPLTGTEVLVFL